MSGFNVVQQHHLQDFGYRVAAGGSRLNLSAQIRAETGEFRLFERRRRLGVRDRRPD
jgi:hypothetical protein